MGAGASDLTELWVKAGQDDFNDFVRSLPQEQRDKLSCAFHYAMGTQVAPGIAGLEQDELSRYFAGSYLQGKLFEGTKYTKEAFDEVFRYDASDGPVQIWCHALDLRDLQAARDDNDLIIVYHYTNELAFLNVTNPEQTAAELFASLLDSRAHFGKGVYGTRHESAVWGSRLQILLNNYSNGSPLCASDAEAERVAREWGDANPQGHRAAFCVPILAPKAVAFNIFERQTPDMIQKIVQDPDTGKQRPIGLGEDYRGRPVHRDRDVFVLRVENTSGEVQNASAGADGLLRLLRLRLAHLRDTRGDVDEATLFCMFELGRRLGGRALYEEAETLMRECLAGRRAKLGDDHMDILPIINNLAQLLLTSGQVEEAEPLFREALRGNRAKFGNDHPNTLSSVNNLASLLQEMGKLEEAEPLNREALEVRRVKLGNEHPDTLTSINNLASLLQAQGRFGEAEPLFREQPGCSTPRSGYGRPSPFSARRLRGGGPSLATIIG
ncbi:KLC1 [Symbiodinium sp. CCMP2456]|nr:KLC1 [Symbiodinium sp. CCMP2456]